MRPASRRPGAVIAVAALLLTACGSAGDRGTAGSSRPAVGATGGTPSAVTTTEPAPDLPSPSTSPAKGTRSLTVTGTLEQGVEVNCVLLGPYLLLGGPREILRPGRTLTVTGRLAEGVVTTCQQGTPLRVDQAVPAPAPSTK